MCHPVLRYITRDDRNSQVWQCLGFGFCAASDFCASLDYESTSYKLCSVTTAFKFTDTDSEEEERLSKRSKKKSKKQKRASSPATEALELLVKEKELESERVAKEEKAR